MDIRPKTSIMPSKSCKNQHFGMDMPLGCPRKDFGLKNLGADFRSLTWQSGFLSSDSELSEDNLLSNRPSFFENFSAPRTLKCNPKEAMMAEESWMEPPELLTGYSVIQWAKSLQGMQLSMSSGPLTARNRIVHERTHCAYTTLRQESLLPRHAPAKIL